MVGWKLVQMIRFNLWEENVEMRVHWIQGLILRVVNSLFKLALTEMILE